MRRKLKVLIVSPEVYPFAKSGQLADIASSLSKALSSLNLEVSIAIPKYRKPEIESLTTELIVQGLEVPLGKKVTKANIYQSELEKSTIYFIDNPKYFFRDNIYGTNQGDYLDNDERFIFFNRATLEFLIKTKKKFDIIHCQNWPTALIPVFLNTHYSNHYLFKNTATVLTIHTMAYQGQFPPESLLLTELNWNLFTSQKLAFNGKFNFLKAGLLYADVLTTVSQKHVQEILTGECSFGLEEVINLKGDSFFGIINGIDYEIWDPEHDKHIAANYHRDDLESKKICKKDLIKEFNLKVNEKTPIIAIISYLTVYKGFDLLFEIIDELMKMDLALIALVKGDEKYEEAFNKIHRKYPRRIGLKLDINPNLAHKIVAGADIFLIPSKYEPCGLNQFYGFRYGTVPIVRATGGLDETVQEFNLQTLKGNGFKFKSFSARELLEAIKRALDCYRQPHIWQRIMRNGMAQDFSWKTLAERYLKVYQLALKKRRAGQKNGTKDKNSE
ncbi:MAG: glycogen synthase [Candidatus Aminicenantia bacterium]